MAITTRIYLPSNLRRNLQIVFVTSVIGFFFVFAIALLLPPPKGAWAGTAYWPGVASKWVAADKCAAAARKAFPDFTAEANAKRDAALKNCLASGNLPPRQ